MNKKEAFFISSVSGLVVFGCQFASSFISGNYALSSQIQALDHKIDLTNTKLQEQIKSQNVEISTIRADITFIKQDAKK